MRLGLGTGTTADFFIDMIGKRIRDEGLSISAVATSSRTVKRAEQAGIELSDLSDLRHLDLTVDGADEVDARLHLIKGGGGALFREKIVACASEEMFVIADQAKWVEQLGKFPLPIEIDRFGAQATSDIIRTLLGDLGYHGCSQNLRSLENAPIVTDGGNYIIDAKLHKIDDARQLATQLNAIPGVVETGLFVDICVLAILGYGNGKVEVIGRNDNDSGEQRGSGDV